jgi:hypothetical protein
VLAVEPQHIAFPGFAPAFNAAWPTRPRTTITAVDPQALSRALHIANRHEAIKAAVDLYVTPLLAATARLEDPPKFWFVVIPEEVFELGRPLSRVSAKERIQGEVQMTKDQARNLEGEPTLVWPGRSRSRYLPLRHALPTPAEGAASHR